MRAMILAAGYGTRLKPLTDTKPKALVELNGIPILELLIKKLIRFGITDIIINAHHFSEMIIGFLKVNHRFGINIEVRVEEEILGTGGGIKNVASFFRDGHPFIVHNVDIITNFDLPSIYRDHVQHQRLVTLMLMERKSDRYFLVDSQHIICGHGDEKRHQQALARAPSGDLKKLAFCGIHIISPRIFPLIEEQGHFSVIDLYLRLIAEGQLIGGHVISNHYWNDIGKLENIRETESDIRRSLIQI